MTSTLINRGFLAVAIALVCMIKPADAIEISSSKDSITLTAKSEEGENSKIRISCELLNQSDYYLKMANWK